MQDHLEGPEAALTAFDRRVYGAVCIYAPDEPECWPSQHLIALDLGCARESVNRCVQRLIEAGWLCIKERRMGRRGWLHNVYELLHEFPAISSLAMKRIVKRAHRRARRSAVRSHDHSNSERGPSGDCGCPSCRPDQPRRWVPPPRLPCLG